MGWWAHYQNKLSKSIERANSKIKLETEWKNRLEGEKNDELFGAKPGGGLGWRKPGLFVSFSLFIFHSLHSLFEEGKQLMRKELGVNNLKNWEAKDNNDLVRTEKLPKN